MKQETYIRFQLDNINEAISLGKTALDSAKSLQGRFGNRDTNTEEADSFERDSLKFYDFNDAIKLLEWMPVQLKDFKNQMIEIKIANDKMLLEGGFIPAIDKEIAHIFLSHTLCKMKAMDPTTIEAIQDAINTLEKLKGELTM